MKGRELHITRDLSAKDVSGALPVLIFKAVYVVTK